MKIANKVLKGESSGTKTMPADLRERLNGLTINEALERDIINDLGDENGKLIFQHGDENIDAAYAIVQGYAVRVSGNLKDGIDNLNDIVGDLRFQKGVSTIQGDGFGKEFFRLGMPAGINLGKEIYTLEAETVGVR